MEDPSMALLHARLVRALCVLWLLTAASCDAPTPGATDPPPATSTTGGGGEVGGQGPTQGGGGAGGGTEPPGGQPVLVESSSPLVEIRAPNFGADLATAIALVTLEGVAREDVVSVAWSVEGGASGTADGSVAWTAADVPLAPGDNRITVTASAQGGATGTDEIVVTFNPGAPITSHLALSQTVAIVGEPALIFAGVWIDPASTPSEVAVGPSGSDGALTETWATLSPSAQKGYWSGSFKLAPDAAASWSVRARATFGASVGHTPAVTLWALDDLDDAAIDAALATFDGASSAWEKAGGIVDPAAAQKAATAVLLADPLVLQVGTSGDGGYGLWWIAKPGVAFHLLGNPEGTRGSGSAALSTPRLHHPSAGPGVMRGATRSSLGVSGREGVPYNGGGGVQTIRSNFGIALAAYLDQFGASDESPAVNADWNSRPCPQFTSNLLVNAAATLVQFESQFDDGLVQVSSHGDTILTGGTAPVGWGTNVGAGQVTVLTREPVTPAAIRANRADFRAGNLAVCGTGAAAVISYLPGWVAAKTAALPMPSSAVAMSSCRSAWNGTMAQAYLAGGAGLYVGYTDYVGSGYAQARTQAFWNDLGRVRSSSDAVTTMSTPFVADDAVDPAYPAAFGNTNNLFVGMDQIKNGGFEDGANEWNKTAGKAAFSIGAQINGIAGTTPAEGSLFGYTTSSFGAGLWNEWGHLFCPAEGETLLLELEWQVVTEEYVDCSTSAPPYIRVYLDRDEGRTQLWSVGWAEICPLLSPAVTVRTTGWQHAAVPVTGLATGNPATERLTFDLGANWITYQDSWYLIDAVAFTRSGP
jgi:hypothetical protein